MIIASQLAGEREIAISSSFLPAAQPLLLANHLLELHNHPLILIHHGMAS